MADKRISELNEVSLPANAGMIPIVQDGQTQKITFLTLKQEVLGSTTASTGKFTSVTTPSVTASSTDLTLNSVGSNAININNDVLKVYRNNTVTSDTASFTAPAFTFIPPQTGYGASIFNAGINPRITTNGTDGIQLQTGSSTGYAGITQAKIVHTASAVNYVQVTGAATGGGVTLSAQGSDANVSLTLRSKGSNEVTLGNGNTFRIFSALGASGTNYPQTTSSATGQAIQYASAGTDTNISMAFQPKGTGAIDLAAGSSGVNISNGGTVTATQVSAIGSNYTSIPSVAISTPTTAGGVQATANAQMGVWSTPITSGGTGYTVNDVLTLVGGTFLGGTAQQIRVTAVSGGVITAVSVVNFPTYTVLPTTPTSVTGGTGTGATFSLTWSVYSLAITNAGSGYIEQPSITFSGGGGSGATAYAIVGSDPILRSLTTTMRFLTAQGEAVRITGGGNTLTDYLELSGGVSGVTNGVYVKASGSSTNQSLYLMAKGTSNVGMYTNWTSGTALQFQASHTASAVNWVQATGSSTGNQAVISVQGSDTNIPIAIAAKGSGTINLQQTTALGRSSTNWLSVNGSSASGNAVQANIFGADTNVSMAFQPKGTGAINLAAGSSGVNISNGGTVTAITRTAAGSGYTTIPSVAISAPTTAGGVQATASVTAMTVNSVTIANGGTGYTVGNVLTVSGGTIAPSQLATQVTVSTVSSGVITAVTISQFGTYSVLPTNPASVTGGTGTGATFNFAYAISGASTNFTITNAGSGYIEQPTVTFSGGGGSGASAYATVGSATVFKSLGGTSGTASINFQTPSSITSNLPALRILDGSAGYDTFTTIQPASAYTVISAAGNAGANLFLSATGAGSVRLMTGGTSLVEQARVSHTASAVNYVQVTGAATTGTPVVQAQGSDTNVSLAIRAKGGGNLFFQPNSLNQFAVIQTASAVNYLQATGSAAGSAPAFSVAGSDTNIDLALTSKGTGSVNLNTGNGTAFKASQTYLTGTAVNYFDASGRQTGLGPIFSVNGSDADVRMNITAKGTGSIGFYTNLANTLQMQITPTASAVNYVQVTGGATTVSPVISAQGSDTNISLNLSSKGTGVVNSNPAMNIGRGSTNWVQGAGSSTGVAVGFSALGGDTNIDLALTPKGTGVVQFGTHTANADVAISGFITIRDAGGTLRKLAVIT